MDTTHAAREDAKRLPTELWGITYRATNRDGSTSIQAWTFGSKEQAFRAAARACRLGCRDVRLVRTQATWEPVDVAVQPKSARAWLSGFHQQGSGER